MRPGFGCRFQFVAHAPHRFESEFWSSVTAALIVISCPHFAAAADERLKLHSTQLAAVDFLVLATAQVQCGTAFHFRRMRHLDNHLWSAHVPAPNEGRRMLMCCWSVHTPGAGAIRLLHGEQPCANAAITLFLWQTGHVEVPAAAQGF